MNVACGGDFYGHLTTHLLPKAPELVVKALKSPSMQANIKARAANDHVLQSSLLEMAGADPMATPAEALVVKMDLAISDMKYIRLRQKFPNTFPPLYLVRLEKLKDPPAPIPIPNAETQINDA
eukprot:gene7056-152_t